MELITLTPQQSTGARHNVHKLEMSRSSVISERRQNVSAEYFGSRFGVASQLS